MLALLLDDTTFPSCRIQTFLFQPSPPEMSGLLCASSPVISCSRSSWFVAVLVRCRMQVGVLELLVGVSKTRPNCSVSPVVWGRGRSWCHTVLHVVFRVAFCLRRRFVLSVLFVCCDVCLFDVFVLYTGRWSWWWFDPDGFMIILNLDYLELGFGYKKFYLSVWIWFDRYCSKEFGASSLRVDGSSR